ncbi:AfsR/SARP family transcriptional regulator [Spirillospora sp. NBC_00431]
MNGSESDPCLRVLGPLEIGSESRSSALGTPKQRALLGTLLLDANRTVSVARIAGALWEGTPPRSANANVQTYVSGVRRILEERLANGGGRIMTRHPGYAISVAPGELDLAVFTALADRGRAELRNGDPASAAETLGDAMLLWRGRPLEDIPLSSLLEAQVVALEDMRVSVLNDWAAARLQLGEHEDLISELRLMTGCWPLSERTWYHLMLALYRSGRRADALEAFMQARQAMVSQVGIEPSEQLRAVQEAILAEGSP